MAITSKTRGEKHILAADALIHIALACRHLNHFDESLQKYEQALEIYKEKLGEKNEKVASILTQVGILYDKKGKLDLASQSYSGAIDIYSAIGKNESLDVAPTLFNLGLV